MALPAPHSPLGSRASRSASSATAEAGRLAPARGIMIGLGLAAALFWGPLAAGLVWLLD